MLNQEILKKLAERHGKEIRYPSDVESLSEHIFEVTKERVSQSTLKRMFGFISAVRPRRSTLDILSVYLGYPDYKTLAIEIGDNSEISEFSPIEEVISTELEEGTQIEISYDPDRVLVITYIGDNYYIVNESINSSLKKGDKIKVSNLTLGFKLLSSEVIRNNKNLGAYTTAKLAGITRLMIIN